MNNQIVSLILNKEFTIEVELPCPYTDLLFFYDLTIYLVHNKRYLLFANDICLEAFRSLHYTLEAALANKLTLHNSITQDIGYVWNEYLHEDDLDNKKNRFFYKESSSGEKFWIGHDYLVWDSKEYDTWIYTKNNTIYFEVTPCYRWHFADPEEGDNYVPFATFLKNYKPLLVTELSQETAQQWFNQTKEALAIMESNEKRHRDAQEQEPGQA